MAILPNQILYKPNKIDNKNFKNILFNWYIQYFLLTEAATGSVP